MFSWISSKFGNSGEKVVEKGGTKELIKYPPISTAEIEQKIEESKREWEKWEEIRQLKEIQEKIDSSIMEEKKEEEDWKCIPKSTYRHIVFSGGAAGGLYIYGALKTAHQKGLWNYDDIKTVWGTSAGSMLAVCVALKYDWSILDDYLIKRPWNTVFKMNLMRLWNEKGLMGKEVVEEIMGPLLAGKDLKMDITMGELFLVTGIEIHIFITELIYSGNEFCSIDISHKTHPDWRVVDTVYASSCLPLVFVPYEISEWCSVGDDNNSDSENEKVEKKVEKKGEEKREGVIELIEKRRLFLDGGILAAFPFYHCIHCEGVDESEVLGFYLNKWEDKNAKNKLQEGLKDMFSFVKSFASAVFNYTDKTGRKPPKTEKACLILLKMNILDRFDMALVRSEEKRREYISIGSHMCMDSLLEKGVFVRDRIEPETKKGEEEGEKKQEEKGEEKEVEI
jgi:predicted acylesterase/phospholipase RssA